MTKLTYTQKVLPLFTLSLFIASIGAFIGIIYIGIIAQPVVMAVLFILEFVLLFASLAAKRKRDVGGMLLFGFVFVSGLVISPLISYYLLGGEGYLIAEALFLTAAVFGGLSIYAYISGNSFSRLGGFLFVGLIGIILASLANIFVQSTGLSLIVNIGAILIFSGYVLYDMGRILNQYSDNEIYPAVLSLFIDFLNLFVNILELLGVIERRK